jgi:hypothetical protein
MQLYASRIPSLLPKPRLLMPGRRFLMASGAPTVTFGRLSQSSDYGHCSSVSQSL